MAFPAAPTAGTTFVAATGITYTFQASGGWKITSAGSPLSTIPDAVLGLVAPDNTLVLASDGSLMLSNTGVPITIAAPITGAGLIAQGFTSVGGSSTIPNASIGSIVPIKTNIISSDGAIMINNTLLPITLVAPITTAGLIAQGLIVPNAPNIGAVITPATATTYYTYVDAWGLGSPLSITTLPLGPTPNGAWRCADYVNSIKRYNGASGIATSQVYTLKVNSTGSLSGIAFGNEIIVGTYYAPGELIMSASTGFPQPPVMFGLGGFAWEIW